MVKFQADHSYRTEQYSDALCYYQEGQGQLMLCCLMFSCDGFLIVLTLVCADRQVTACRDRPKVAP